MLKLLKLTVFDKEKRKGVEEQREQRRCKMIRDDSTRHKAQNAENVEDVEFADRRIGCRLGVEFLAFRRRDLLLVTLLQCWSPVGAADHGKAPLSRCLLSAFRHQRGGEMLDGKTSMRTFRPFDHSPPSSPNNP